MLNESEFNIIVHLEKNQDVQFTQRKLSKVLDVSLGLINKGINKLLELKYISSIDKNIYLVTDLGYQYLEKHKVKRAIFFAAGYGERLMPLTQNTAKALINLNGKRIIDRTLDALIKKGIEEIIIVRGYLGEQFVQLLLKYPMIKFIESETYATSKNITSAYLAREYFENSYIIEADTVLENHGLIQTYEFTSHYKTVNVERSDSWSFKVQGNKIKKYSLGGHDVHEVTGISYWNQEDGQKLREDIETHYHEPGMWERFWDDIPLVIEKGNYDLMVKDYNEGDAYELGSFQQLIDIDPSHKQ